MLFLTIFKEGDQSDDQLSEFTELCVEDDAKVLPFSSLLLNCLKDFFFLYIYCCYSDESG